MNLDQLCAEAMKRMLSYTPDSGLFTWSESCGRAKKGSIAGTPHGASGYTKIVIMGRQFLAHRLAWFFHYGEWPIHQIDHINGVRNDNRISNLRDVSSAVNHQNRRFASRMSKTGLLGVGYDKRRSLYYSKITINKKSIWLGYFKTCHEAHSAYVEHKRELHEGCTI